LPQDTADFALEAGKDPVGCPLRRCRNEHLQMNRQNVECQYLALKCWRGLADEFDQMCFQSIKLGFCVAACDIIRW
jgi:hypothetical protein